MAEFNIYDENIKYVFKKPYVTGQGTLRENSEIRLFRGGVYYDGGMVPGAYAQELINLIKDKNLREEYLKPMKLIKDIVA